MSLFDWLLVAHLFGDFALQADNMAFNKARQWPWMLRHVGCYMIPVTLVIVAYSWTQHISAWWVLLALLFVAGTHIVLDRRTFTLAWMRMVRMSPDHPWLPIVVDQVFHILVLAIVAQVLVTVSG